MIHFSNDANFIYFATRYKDYVQGPPLRSPVLRSKLYDFLSLRIFRENIEILISSILFIFLTVCYSNPIRKQTLQCPAPATQTEQVTFGVLGVPHTTSVPTTRTMRLDNLVDPASALACFSTQEQRTTSFDA